MAEKTEKATPKKLRDAKKKGQIAKSQDLPSAFTFIVSIWVTLGLATYLYHTLADFTVEAFRLIPHENLSVTLTQVFMSAFIVIFVASIPIMVLVAFVGVTVTFLTVGPVFAPEVFQIRYQEI